MSPINPANIVTGPLVWLDDDEPLLGRQPAGGAPLWWMSFCDPAAPAGSQFLGVAIVQAPDLESAVTRSHVLGVNPGGEIQIAGPIPEGWIGPEWRDRLLAKAEAEAIPEPGGLGDSAT